MRYYEGYQEARTAVRNMTDTELLGHIDSLYGRDNLPDDYNREDLLMEALAQTALDFETPDGREDRQWAERYTKAMIAQFGPPA